MSRTRITKTSAKYSKPAEVSRQQKKLYLSQKKAGMMDKTPEFHFEPAGSETSSLISWFFLLNLLVSAAAQVATNDNHPGNNHPDTNRKIDKEVADLVRSRLGAMDVVTQSEKNARVCDRIANRIGALAAVNDAFRANVLSAFLDRNFQIVCTKAKIQFEKFAAYAMFLPISKQIILPYDLLRDHEMAHEFYHAQKHEEHSPAGNCYLSAESGLSSGPVFPMTAKNINKFNKYMDQGDKNVQELYAIARKLKNGDLLTSDEEFKYLRAKKELKGTILITDIMDLPIAELASFQQQGWPLNKNIRLTVDGGIEVRVKNIVNNKDSIRVFFCIDEPIMAIYSSVNQFNKHKANGLFTSVEQEAAERLAHTFQCLTLQGRKYLYPKADQLLEEQKNLCMPNKLEL